MSALPSYPENVPTSSFATIIEILRTGQVAGRYPELLWHEWIVQGWVCRLVAGVGDEPKTMRALDTAVLSSERATELFKFVHDLQSATGDDTNPAGTVTISGPITAGMAAEILAMLLAIVKRQIEKYLWQE